MKQFNSKNLKFLIPILVILILSPFCKLNAQTLSLSYEKTLDDLKRPSVGAFHHTDSGFALYYGGEDVGTFDDFVKLRNNNALIWKTQMDKSPENIRPTQFYEDQTGFYYIDEFFQFGRLNKTTGNIEAKRSYTDLGGGYLLSNAITSTHGGNYIIGGEYGNWPTNAVMRVVNSLSVNSVFCYRFC